MPPVDGNGRELAELLRKAIAANCPLREKQLKELSSSVEGMVTKFAAYEARQDEKDKAYANILSKLELRCTQHSRDIHSIRSDMLSVDEKKTLSSSAKTVGLFKGGFVVVALIVVSFLSFITIQISNLGDRLGVVESSAAAREARFSTHLENHPDIQMRADFGEDLARIYRRLELLETLIRRNGDAGNDRE